MTRLPLATDLKTRIGATSTKDARQVNSYVEVKGDQTVVRKRPAAQGGIAVGTGTAQGGIGLTINGTPYFIGFWGDVLYSYSGSGTSWSSGTFYLQGDHVSVDFVDYWALQDNQGNNPSSTSSYWSRVYVPAKPRFSTTPSGGVISVTISSSTVLVGNTYTTTRIYTTRDLSNNIIDSGTGTNTYPNIAPPGGDNYVWSNYMLTAAELSSAISTKPAGVTISYASGYDFYLINGTWTIIPPSTWSGEYVASPY